MLQCSVEGCTRFVIRPSGGRAGMCTVHYRRSRKGSIPLGYSIGYKRVGKLNPSWKGGVITSKTHGYRFVFTPDHPRSNNGYVAEHILIVESILGRYLASPECIHHVDENRGNNENSNLVLCPDQGYHLLLHQNLKALKATGDSTKRRCRYCKQWDDIVNLQDWPSRKWGAIHRYSHRECHNEYCRNAYRRRAVNG